jgi:hypothetical protein
MMPGGAERPSNVRALIFTIKAKDEEDLYRRCSQAKLPALVVNKIVSLKSGHKSLLQKSYPGTNFDKCLIIQEGREPASDSKLMLMIGGGGVAAVLGLGLIGFGIIRRIMGK